MSSNSRGTSVEDGEEEDDKGKGEPADDDTEEGVELDDEADEMCLNEAVGGT